MHAQVQEPGQGTNGLGAYHGHPPSSPPTIITALMPFRSSPPSPGNITSSEDSSDSLLHLGGDTPDHEDTVDSVADRPDEAIRISLGTPLLDASNEPRASPRGDAPTEIIALSTY